MIEGANGKKVYCSPNAKTQDGDCFYKLADDTDAYQGKTVVPASGLLVDKKGRPVTTSNLKL
jgi:hypothetical protein